jgi:hypothetical protein
MLRSWPEWAKVVSDIGRHSPDELWNGADDSRWWGSPLARGGLRSAPAAYRVRVTAKSPGVGKLVFDYLRPEDGRPIRSETRSVNISGR